MFFLNFKEYDCCLFDFNGIFDFLVDKCSFYPSVFFISCCVSGTQWTMDNYTFTMVGILWKRTRCSRKPVRCFDTSKSWCCCHWERNGCHFGPFWHSLHFRISLCFLLVFPSG